MTPHPLRRVLTWSGIAVLLVWSLGPVYWAVVSALTPNRDFSERPIRLIPRELTLDHFKRLLGIDLDRIGGIPVWAQFRTGLFNSVVTSVAATLLCVIFSALAAYAFTRLRFPGRRTIFFGVIATMAIPGYAVLIPLYRMMIALHWVDTYQGVTLIYVSSFLPLSLWLMRGVYEALPIALEEAAQIDGAGRLYVFTRIVLPLVGPGLTATAILAFLGAWGQYMVPLIFSPTVTKPLTLLIPEFSTKNLTDYGLIMAAGSIAIILPALVVVFLNRYLVSGLLAGAVK